MVAGSDLSGQEMIAVNEKFPHVMSGPEHLELGLSLAAAAQAAIADGAPAGPRKNAAVLAQLAQVHVTAAQVMVFGTLAAGEELGAPWADLVDPTGELREAAEEREAYQAEKRRADAEAEAALREQIEAKWATPDTLQQPGDYWPTPGFDPSPLVPPVDTTPAAAVPAEGEVSER